MTRILIAGGHPVIRSGIRHCIREAPDLTVVHEAGTDRELFAFLDHAACEVVVLDITRPDMNGPELLRTLNHARPELPVLILTLFPEDPAAGHGLRDGAAGLLTLSSEPVEIIDAIRRAARGGRPATRATSGRPAIERHDAPAKSPHTALSVREFQVFCQIAQGRAQKAIAAGLGLSAKTICTHRFRILKKLCIQSNADIVRYALTHQLVA